MKSGLKEGGGTEMSIYSAFHIRDCTLSLSLKILTSISKVVIELTLICSRGDEIFGIEYLFDGPTPLCFLFLPPKCRLISLAAYNIETPLPPFFNPFLTHAFGVPIKKREISIKKKKIKYVM